MNSYNTLITPKQAMLICDNLIEPLDSDELDSYRVLLLKVFTPLVENKSTEVSLTIFELWQIKSIAKSSITYGTDRVGLELLINIAKGLQALYAEEATNLIVTNSVDSVVGNDIKYSDVKEK